jgi:hypothetical protein
VDADSEQAARALAREQGMEAEAVELVVDPIPPPAIPPRPAEEPVTSREQLRRLGGAGREQLRRLGRVAEAYGFRLLVIGCLTALLVLAVRINSQLMEIHQQVEFIRMWMPRR